ncbi:MAG: proton-conducting transporter membrane subunit, partial [Pseudomonadota bacterium]
MSEPSMGFAEVVRENLPILQVILPLMAAPLCVLVRRGQAAWALATGVTWMTFAISWSLLQSVLRYGFISYAVGDWPAPWGIELRIEPVNALVLLIVSGIAAVVVTFSQRSLDSEVPAGRHYLFYSAFLLCMTGLLGMASAGDAFNVFVFLEISSLSSYSLIALGRHRRALTSSFRYLILGTLGGTSILFGVGLLYMSTGTLNLVDLGHRLQDVGPTRTVMVALAAVVVGSTL